MKLFRNAFFGVLLSFVVGATGANAQEQQEQNLPRVEAAINSSGEVQAAGKDSNAVGTESAPKRSRGLFRVLAGVVSFGAIVASAVTNSPVDSLTYIAVSIGADQAAK